MIWTTLGSLIGLLCLTSMDKLLLSLVVLLVSFIIAFVKLMMYYSSVKYA